MKKTILILSVLFFLSCKKENLYNIQNVITPNGDGINDTWVIPFENVDVSIYDLNYNLVYHSSNYQQDFEGFGVNASYYYSIKNKVSGVIKVLK